MQLETTTEQDNEHNFSTQSHHSHQPVEQLQYSPQHLQHSTEQPLQQIITEDLSPEEFDRLCIVFERVGAWTSSAFMAGEFETHDMLYEQATVQERNVVYQNFKRFVKYHQQLPLSIRGWVTQVEEDIYQSQQQY
jgi:hypothetical protein